MTRPVFYDSETWPIQPGRQAPPVVCGQFADAPGEADILLKHPTRARLTESLKRGVAGHSISYDMAVAGATWPEMLPAIFDAYEADRVTCTKLRQRLVDIAKGRQQSAHPVSYLACLDRHRLDHRLTAEDKKSGAWRTRYHELDGVPVEQWPADAKRYAEEDVRNGHALMDAQAAEGEPLEDQYRQARGDFMLTLTRAHGMRVDQDYVQRYAQVVDAERDQIKARLTAAGLIRWDGTKDTKRAKALMEDACRLAGVEVPRTEKNAVSLKAENVDRVAAVLGDDDHLLSAYARFGSLTTLKGRARRLALAGDLPIQTRFDALKDTGRTSSQAGIPKPGKDVLAWGDQTQNMPREVGLRECYRARPGYVLCSVDWSAAELSTLAEACLHIVGYSQLGETIRAGKDPHLAFACAMHGWDYEWAKAAKASGDKRVKTARQSTKAANFGYPGGLGAASFRAYAAATYGVKMSEQEARDLKGQWLANQPEMPEYFNHVNSVVAQGGSLMHIYSGRKRGGVYYTNGCNSYFQGLASDMAKDAGFVLARECYLPGGVLFGSRIVNFIHDEFILEVPLWKAHECAMRIVEVMEDAGRRWAPSAPPAAEPALSYRWRKGADPVYVNGRLTPWEDRPVTDGERAWAQKLRDEGESEWMIALKTGREM